MNYVGILGRVALGILLTGTVSAQTVRFDDELRLSAADPFDNYGTAVVLQGNTLFVGVPGDDSAAAGIDGDPDDDSATDTGSVYVYERDGDDWVQQAYIKPNDPVSLDDFGMALAVDGNTLVVGAPGKDIPFAASGAAYVFIRVGDDWLQQGVLRAQVSGFAEEFGSAVAIQGDTIVVGAPFESGGSPGVNGDQSDKTATFAGAAYVFTRTAGVWTQEAYLKSPAPDAADIFGYAVDLDGDTIVVGAVSEDGLSTGVDGDPTDDGGTFSDVGAAFVFVRDGGSWTQQAYLKASNTDA